jgi:tetratricopeptide (TPR) repeat protein
MDERVESRSGRSAYGAKAAPTPQELLEEGLRLEKAGLLDRAMERYEAVLARTADQVHTSEALRRQSHVQRTRCSWDEALDAARRSAAAAERAGSPDLLAEALNAEAAVHQSRGDFEAASALYLRMLDLVESGRVRGVALLNLASIRAMQGDLDLAEHELYRALECFEAARYEWGKAFVLNNVGRVELDRGATADAAATLEEAMALAHNADDFDLFSLARLNHAEALLGLGDAAAAEEAASASIGHFTTCGNHWRRIDALRLLGDVGVHRGELEGARRCYIAARDLAERLGARVEHEQVVQRLRDLEARGAS